MSLTLLFALALVQPPASTGATLFDTNCASCHAQPEGRTPPLASLRQRTPEAIVEALTIGSMREQGSTLRDSDKRAIAEFLTGRAPGASAAAPSPTAGRCAAVPPFDASTGPHWTGWSNDLANTRFQPAPQAGLTAEQAPKLVLKWAFGFPNATAARALPTIAGGRVFVGSQSGIIYALDAKTGCIIWTYQAKAGVRSGIVGRR